MTTLNSEKYLEEAIKSILDQTFKFFELLIIDGGSIDTTAYIVSSIQDKRIKYCTKKGGRGAQLNYGIRESKGAYIAIMDSDDIAYPMRLQVQLEFMEKHPTTYLLGSWAKLISEEKEIISELKRPLMDKVIKENLLARNGISFPTLMINKKIFLGDIYINESLEHSEDLEFFIRLPEECLLSNIPEFLMQLRQTRNSRSRKDDLCKNSLLRALEFDLKQKIFKHTNPCLNNRHLGIAHYYYGKCKTARKHLILSLLNNPFQMLTFRYLLPSLLGDQLLHKIRSNHCLLNLADRFRKMCINK